MRNPIAGKKKSSGRSVRGEENVVDITCLSDLTFAWLFKGPVFIHANSPHGANDSVAATVE
jgi:hypothetical protein